MGFLSGPDSQKLFICIKAAIEELLLAIVVIHEDTAMLGHIYHPIFK